MTISGYVDALQISARDAEVRVAELALDYTQRTALIAPHHAASHLGASLLPVEDSSISIKAAAIQSLLSGCS